MRLREGPSPPGLPRAPERSFCCTHVHTVMSCSGLHDLPAAASHSEQFGSKES